MNIAIRVDSSATIGSGHLMRCLTLAECLRREQGAKVHFISRDLVGNLYEIIKEAGFTLHILPCHPRDEGLAGYAAWLTVPQKVDATETKSVLQSIGELGCLVVDNYALDYHWEREMRPFTQKIFVIDDLANRSHDCDILLDQNFYLAKERRYIGLVPESCKLLIGPRYALLREEFYKTRKYLRKKDGKLRRILVFYGGSDLTNETMKALRALKVFKKTTSELFVDVIVGGSNPYQKEIKAFCSTFETSAWMKYYFQVNNMAELMGRADLMLGAGGSTTWERCFLELPSIVTVVAKNQEQIAEDCASAGYIIYLGRASDVAEEHIVSALQTITTEQLMVQQKRMRELFRDGEMIREPLFT